MEKRSIVYLSPNIKNKRIIFDKEFSSDTDDFVHVCHRNVPIIKKIKIQP